MKICHVITRMIVGGAQENTLLSVIGQLEAGHQLTLISGPSPGREGELLKNADYPDFELIIIPELVRELSPVNDLKAYFKLKRLFAERAFDVVHTHSSKAGIIGRAAARNAKIPAIFHTVHGQPFHPYEKWWKNFLYITAERWAARRCDRILAVAEAMIDQCVEHKIAPREKYRVVYSGMQMQNFLSAQRDPLLRAQLGIPEEATVIATLARLFPLKGYEFVLPAAEKLKSDFPSLHYLVIGDGPMEEKFKAQIREAGLEDHFHFAGLVRPDDVGKYLIQSDLLWHLSLREGLPRSVVQALACGIPAIGFALDGTPEVILDNETGYLASPENVEEVVARTTRLLNNPELRKQMGINGQKLVKERFDWRLMANILLEEYADEIAKTC